MNKRFLLFLALIAIFRPVLGAPGDPAFVFPKGNAAWTVDIASESKTLRPVRVEVTQVDDLKRTRISWSDGSTSEKWNVPGLPVTFHQDPKNKAVKARQSGSSMDAVMRFGETYDSFAFEWIRPEFLKEKEPISYNGVRCYHYVGTSSFMNSDEKIPAVIKKEAWIDEKTLLPVALVTGEGEGSTTTIFKFQTNPPTGPLSPPREFSEAINYYKAVMGF